jgi:hypothetical protein
MLYLQGVPAVRATSDWIKALDGNQTTKAKVSLLSRNPVTINQAHVQKKEPSKEEFNNPLTGVEHNSMVAKLRLGGLTENEAEQTKSFRKTAFNKAVREFKKESGMNTKSNPKKLTKNTKQVASKVHEHAN